ncbi:MAG TPA: MBL fold metallo-hydrolase [Thermomicrobiales bacterium]|nr:MBL fold metallo-hydrolase [Thermomicrobiales bacterium]
MTLTIRTFTGGPLETHGFLVFDRAGRAIVVDVPPGQAEPIAAGAKSIGATIGQIVITHPHWDHFADAASLRELTGAPIAAHPGAEPRLRDARTSLFPVDGVDFGPASLLPDRGIDEGDVVDLGDSQFQVLFTPGHEPAHIALFEARLDFLLSGDVIFPGGHGTLDVPSADAGQMRDSLLKLAALPGRTVVYNGHGRTTTLRQERHWLPKPDVDLAQADRVRMPAESQQLRKS